MTQMYGFRLGIDPAKIPPAEKYVLAVTYSFPLRDHLTGECVVSYNSVAAVGSPNRQFVRRSGFMLE